MIVETRATAARESGKTLTKSGLLADGYAPNNFARPAVNTSRHTGALESYSRFEAPGDVYWDDEKYRGEAYAAYAWPCMLPTSR